MLTSTASSKKFPAAKDLPDTYISYETREILKKSGIHLPQSFYSLKSRVS